MKLLLISIRILKAVNVNVYIGTNMQGKRQIKKNHKFNNHLREMLLKHGIGFVSITVVEFSTAYF